MTTTFLINFLVIWCFVGFSLDYLYRVRLSATERIRDIQDKPIYGYISPSDIKDSCLPSTTLQRKYHRYELERERWAINIDEWFRYGGIDDMRMRKHYIDNHIREAFISMLDKMELDQAYSIKFNSPVLFDKRTGNTDMYPFSFPVRIDNNFDIPEFMARQIFHDHELYIQVDIQKQNTIDCYVPNYIGETRTITRYKNIEKSKVEMLAFAILGK